MSIDRFATPPKISSTPVIDVSSRPIKSKRTKETGDSYYSSDDDDDDDSLLLVDPLTEELTSDAYQKRTALLLAKYTKQIIIANLQKQIKKRQRENEEIDQEIRRLMKKQRELK